MTAEPEVTELDVSIAICTWNRADMLHSTLESLARLRIASGLRWEVLVVDNACTDNTPEILRRHADRLPLRALQEPKPGLANARNCAMRAAHGALLLWTDDDVLVAPDWIEAYVTASRDRPEASAWGGVITPEFETEPPHWLRQAWPVVASVYATRDLAKPAFEIREQADFPYGANWAVRTAVQRNYEFDARLGVCQGSRIAAEETDVLRRMQRDGHRIWWVPESTVRHWIPSERMTLDYIGRYWRGVGETSMIQHDVPPNPTRLYAKAMAREIRYRIGRRVAPAPVWLRSYVRAQYLRGRHIAARKAARAASDNP